jgi:hypothetical protein
VSIAARLSRLCVPFSEKLDSLLDRLGNRRTMSDSRNDALKWALRNQNNTCTVAARYFISYKYLIRLALITISQFFFLSCLGFTFLALRSSLIEDKRVTKCTRSPSKVRSPSPDGAKTPPPMPSGSPPPLTSPLEVSSSYPRSPVWE